MSRIGAWLASLELLVGVVLASPSIDEPLDVAQLRGRALILTAVAGPGLHGRRTDERAAAAG